MNTSGSERQSLYRPQPFIFVSKNGILQPYAFMPDPIRPKLRPTAIQTEQKVGISQRISVGLIALSLSLFSLALGAAFFSPAGPAAFLVAPIAVQTEVTASSSNAVTLLWTAPGDDGNTGQAAQYDIRYSTSAIDSGNFSNASAATSVPAPQTAGTTETYTVTGLQPATTYFFALKTADEAGNWSTISNIASKTTDAAPVACVPTYTCSAWSACIDGRQTRTCTVNNGCSSNLNQPILNQACGTGGQPTYLLNHIIASGVGPGTLPVVRIVNPGTKKATKEFVAFSRSDRHGTNVGVGDVNGDHHPEVLVGTGVGTDPLVKIYSDKGTFIAQFNPYSTLRKSGVMVAGGDVDGDGVDEILTVPAKGASQLKIFHFDPTSKKVTTQGQTFVYARTALQGFSVAAGDLDLDGRAEIVVAPRVNGHSVTIVRFTKSKTFQTVKTFAPYPPTFKSGITVAVGDTDGNGKKEVLTTPGPGYFSHVKAFDIQGHLLRSFQPTSTSYLGGVSLTSMDVNTDGEDEVITGTYQNGDPGLRVFRYSPSSKKFVLIQSYFIYPRTMKSGLRLASE